MNAFSPAPTVHDRAFRFVSSGLTPKGRGSTPHVTALFEAFKKEVPAEIAAAGPRLQELSAQLAALQAKVSAGAASASASAK